MGIQRRLEFERGYQNKFLKEFMICNNTSILSSSRKLKVSEGAFKKWLNETRTLPEEVFVEICNETPELISYKSKVKRIRLNNWGQIKGGRSRILTMGNIEEFYQKLRAVKDKRRREKAKLEKANFKIKNRILLRLINDRVNLLHILATCLLTDGSLTKDGGYRIGFYTKDETLKSFMKELIFTLSDFRPSIYKDRNEVYAIRINDNNLAKKLFSLSPNFKTSPYYCQSKKDYLSEPQPTLSFLNSANKNTVIWSIRFAFTTDGCITISKSNTIELNLACYHSSLSKEWLKLLDHYGISGHLGIDKTSWCGIDGVRIYNISSFKKFAEIGGFIPGVKISSKSKRFKGLEKNMLLKEAIAIRGP